MIAKSSVVLDCKPWDDETDMKEMERLVRSIQKDGLVWGAGKSLVKEASSLAIVFYGQCLYLEPVNSVSLCYVEFLPVTPFAENPKTINNSQGQKYSLACIVDCKAGAFSVHYIA